MKKWLKQLFQNDPLPENTGLILPNDNELAEMPKFTEVVAGAAPVVWKDLDLSKLPKWPIYDQQLTYECVAHTSSLEDTILYWQRRGLDVKFSPTWKYIQRVNKPQGGMIGTDIGRIDKMVGAIPYDLMPTPYSEDEANEVKAEEWMFDIAKVFQTADVPILVPIKDFETAVSIQQVTGKPLMVWFEFSRTEWTQEPYTSTQPCTIRHSVTFVSPRHDGDMTYGLLPSGEKAIVVQDSTFFSNSRDGKRIITESFFKRRNLFTSYKMRFKFDVSPQKKRWSGTIVSLQECLQSIGMFPINVAFVENIGPVTKSAISKYQMARNINITSRLDDITKAALAKEF